MDMYRSCSFAATICTRIVPFLKQGLFKLLPKILSTPLPSISTSQIIIFRSQLGSGYDADMGYLGRVC